MNFVSKTAFSLLGLALVTGCSEKFLDESPRDQFTTELFYKTESDAILATNAVYSQLSNQGQYNYSLWGIGDIMSDNSSTGGGGGSDGLEEQQLDFFNIPTTNLMTSRLWGGCYVGIGAANQVLLRVPDIAMNPALKQRCLGEAAFLRAKYYFDLVRCFGDVPLVLVPPAGPAEARLPRTPAAQVYEQIVRDLETAITQLPSELYSGADLGRATKWSATGLLAKVQLTLGNKGEAARRAKEVINSGRFSLWADYGDNYKLANENGKESVFEVQFVYDPSQSYVFTHLGFVGNEFFAPRFQYLTPVGGYGFNVPEVNFVSGYESGDRRKAVTLWVPGDAYPAGSTTVSPAQPPSLVGSPNGFNVRKWLVPKDVTYVWDSPLNFPVLRLAEMYLIAAEGTGPTHEGFRYLNIVRRRAFGEDFSVNPAFATAPDSLLQATQSHDLNLQTTPAANFDDAVLRERRYELAFEDDRWFDLKRTNKLVNNAHLLTKGIKPFNALLPIPQSERDANPSLTQNPGY